MYKKFTNDYYVISKLIFFFLFWVVVVLLLGEKYGHSFFTIDVVGFHEPLRDVYKVDYDTFTNDFLFITDCSRHQKSVNLSRKSLITTLTG